ncbi:hypothetical protein HDU76_006611 [Blyttiomyces sp. JEL0837]|nr:hypothetical protein HDU76_006611 [Blyttiomyces sp. JEL0837]
MSAATSKNVTVITGGARGIGAAIAKEIASTIPNSVIVINYRSSSTEADSLVSELKALGATALPVQADVGTTAGSQKLIQTTIDHYGHINTLVNNAGIYASAPIGSVTESQYDDVFNSNVKATILVTSIAAKHIVDGGSIVNISSVVTHNPFPDTTVYVASKGAIEAFTRGLAVELAPRKIRVNAVSPGFTQTPMLPEAYKEFAISQTPFRRVGTPEEIATVVGFLAGDKSQWVTGQNIFSSGGISYSF